MKAAKKQKSLSAIGRFLERKAQVSIAGILALTFFLMPLLASCGFLDEGYKDGGREAFSLEYGYEAKPSREKYTRIEGGGEDIVTVMFYLIGSDLETDGGCATDDLLEIMNADLGENVNFVIQTGGAAQWQNELIDPNACERYYVQNGNLEYLGDAQGQSMARSDTLADFISFSAENFPANRYQLIMWNHGGGTMGGFGYDENFDEMMSLPDIDHALTGAGVKFDFIGFDACLMATVETAVMLEKHADYLIASEETEPGNGWYYTDFLTSLGANPSISTVQLGKQIIDDFADSYYWDEETTLSIVDLTEIHAVRDMLSDFLTNSGRIMIEKSEYKTFSNARAQARSYGDGYYEQIDIVDYVRQTGLQEGQYLLGAIGSAVKYRAGSVPNSYGLAMYFPYEDPNYYDDISYMLDEIGMGDGTQTFFEQFLTILAGGQINFGSSFGLPLNETIAEMKQDGTDYENYDWFAPEIAENYEYEDYYDSDALEIIEKNEGFVLSMSDEAWESIISVELQVWFDDGEGYIDLGSDSMYEFDDDGDLLIDFDNSWVAIEGQIVSFYTEKDEDFDNGQWYSYGYVPCFINDVERQLVLAWNNEQPYGYVAGYRNVSVTGGQAPKGLIPLADGDVVDFVADYYTYDGDYEDWYYIGEPLVYRGTDWEVSYEDVGENSCLVFYMLTDLYQNKYYTEALEFYTP